MSTIATKDGAHIYRAGAGVSPGTLDQYWLWSMKAGLKNAYESIEAFSETDFTADLTKIDVPHGLTATHQNQVNADLLTFLRS